MPYILPKAAVCALLFAYSIPAQPPYARFNPAIKQIVDAVSEDRIAATLKRLESFGTRYILSAQDDASKGIGAAKRWIFSEFQSYSPRLQVSYQNFTLKKRAGAVLRDVDLSNVVAVLPGTIDKERYVLVTAHYDSVNTKSVTKPGSTDEERLAEMVKRGTDPDEAKRVLQLFPTPEDARGLDYEATAAQTIAPGVTDDGSGIAAVLELARLMSQYQFDKTIIFIAFAAEEVALDGSRSYATLAKQKDMQIEAVLNNDIIGSDVSGNGRSENGVLRVFADGPEDSPSRALLRFTRQLAERYVPSMKVVMVFHRDRFGRAGDHTSFVAQGFAAVRITTPSENFANQHSATDTFEHTSVPYTARVTRMNAAVLAGLALAPAPPVVNYSIQSGEWKGQRRPMLSRSHYDAVLRWLKSPEPDVAGYAVVIRATTAPDWEREIWVGDVTRYTIPDFSIDDVVIGVKAVDRDGNQSLVAAYLEPVSPQLTAAPASTPKK